MKRGYFKKLIFAVIGSNSCSRQEAAIAEQVGVEIAKVDGLLICGGKGGIMEAACRGAKKFGGTTIGILPDEDYSAVNKYVNIPIVTGMGEARNIIIVRSADIIIAISGEYGTLNEIALALKIGKPVIGIGTWELSKKGKKVKSIIQASDAHDAITKALAIIKQRKSECNETININ